MRMPSARNSKRSPPECGVDHKVAIIILMMPCEEDENQKQLSALSTESVPVDEHCIGDRWEVQNSDQLAKLIAIIAMGQASHAAKIIREFKQAAPVIPHEDLVRAAKQELRVRGGTEEQRKSSRWHRDGFIFEVISWIAARQDTGPHTYLKAPHIKATTQGIDGLMIELDPKQKGITRATIFEDKCSENPRKKFRDEIMPAFQDHHKNNRAPELVDTAAALIEKSGLDESAAVKAAATVLDINYRRYRAALTVTSKNDSEDRRKALFKGYDKLAKIKASQRLGATFVVDNQLRDWFEALASRAIAFLDTFEEETV
jgi:hypothetical protein